MTVNTFNSEEEAISLANCVNYGLAATVWTENDKRARRVANQIEAGIVWVNCWLIRDLHTPFGGMKQSGYFQRLTVELDVRVASIASTSTPRQRLCAWQINFIVCTSLRG